MLYTQICINKVICIYDERLWCELFSITKGVLF